MSSAQFTPPIAAPKTSTTSSATPALVQVQAKASSFFGPPVSETPFFAPARPVGVQMKLSVGRADDGFEREADATADRIVAMPAPLNRPAATPGGAGLQPVIQSKTEEREKKDVQKKEQPEKEKKDIQKKELPEKEKAEPPLIQRKTEDDDQKLRRKGGETATPAPTPSFEAGLAASRSGGLPLAADARQYMEPRFGVDFSGVRVHTDAPAVQLTQSIGAQAFAYQNHVYFNDGKYDTGSSGGRHLLAHELTHVVQQGSAVQRQPLAETAAPAPQISSAAPTVQRLFGIDVAGTIDGWLGVVPGWRLLTTLIGYNPVLQRNVARSTINLLEGFLTLGGPLGVLLFNRLHAEGIIDRAAGWIDVQVASLGISLSYVQGLFSQAWDEMGIEHGIEGNLAIAQRIFGPPISRMIAFGERMISQVVAWLKETILRPLSARARTFRGFPLITVIIGKDPFTDEVVERSPTNLVRGFMLLMDGGEERFNQMQQSGALTKAFAWFNTETAKRNLTWMRIKGVFTAAWDVLTPEAVLHPIETITTIAGLFSSLAADVVSFAGAALMQMLELIFEAVMGAGGARVLAILKRGRDTFNVIIRDPVAFVGNLVRAGRLGFQQFMAKGLQYLQQGVVGWLLGALEGAGLQLPQQFDLRGVLSLVLQVLGLTYQNIRAKLVRATSEAFVARLEQVFDFLRILVTQGPAAAWQKILEYVGNLRDMVLDGIKAWVMRTVVGQAVVRILGMLNPAGAVIQAIMATYNTVMFFIERINQITAVVEAYVDSIAAIAAGNIGAAANRVEQTMGRMVPVIIGFLARLLGLGGISDTIRGLIERVRQPVDRAMDSVVNWVVAQGRRLVGAVAGGAPTQRVDSALAVAVPIINRFAGRPVARAVLMPLLAVLKVRYQLSLLEVVPTDAGVWAVRAAASPSKQQNTNAKVDDKSTTNAAIITKTGQLIPESKRLIFSGGTLAPFTASELLPVAYVGNVPTILGRDISTIANQYEHQGFTSAKDAATRFSLVVGVNTFEDLAGDNEAALSRVSVSWGGYPLGVFGFMWRPFWTSGKRNLAFNEIKALYGSSSETEKSQLKAAQRKATDQSIIPYGEIRNLLITHPLTSSFVGALKARSRAVYIHSGDSDAVSLRVHPQEGLRLRSGAIATSLFERYDVLLQRASQAEKPLPAIASGGYRFRVSAPAGYQPDQQTLTTLASDLDMAIRQAMARINSRTIYFPEPNTIIRVEGNDLSAVFTGGSGEGERMVTKLLQRREGATVLFDARVAIVTDSSRFPIEKGVVETSYKVGRLLPLTELQVKALFQQDQSHARASLWDERMRIAYPALTGKENDQSEALRALRKALFPNEVIGYDPVALRSQLRLFNPNTVAVPSNQLQSLAAAIRINNDSLTDAIRKANQIVSMARGTASAIKSFLSSILFD